MITARHYEDFMKDLRDIYNMNPNEAKRQMDEINIETLSSLGYEAGAKIYSEVTGIRLKGVESEHNS